MFAISKRPSQQLSGSFADIVFVTASAFVATLPVNDQISFQMVLTYMSKAAKGPQKRASEPSQVPGKATTRDGSLEAVLLNKSTENSSFQRMVRSNMKH